MQKNKLQTLKILLEEFYNSPIFGLGELEYAEQVKNVIDLVDGAIINQEME